MSSPCFFFSLSFAELGPESLVWGVERVAYYTKSPLVWIDH